MSSSSIRQANLMAGVAHDPKFAKKVGIPQSVGKDFNAADQKTGVMKDVRPKPVKKSKAVVDPEMFDEEIQEGNPPKTAKAIASGKKKDPDSDTGSALSHGLRKRSGRY